MERNKMLVVATVVALAGGGLWWNNYSKNNPDEIEKAKTEMVVSTNVADNTASTSSASTVSLPQANITMPDRPVDGVKKAVIEVGATGFNCFVIEVDKNKNWEMVSKVFGASLAYEGYATEADLKAGLRSYLSEVFNKGVNGRNVHFVISSGALKNPKTKPISDAIKSSGYVVNEVTPEQEGKMALKSTLTSTYRSNSFVVDLGSGNTKISWYEGSALKSLEGEGAKYAQNNKSHKEVYDHILSLAKQIPVANRSNCFIIGGVPFKLASQSRQNKEDRYTILKSPDQYSAGDDEKIKCGLNIYQAVVDGTQTSNFIFDWDANFTIGFLLGLN